MSDPRRITQSSFQTSFMSGTGNFSPVARDRAN